MHIFASSDARFCHNMQSFIHNIQYFSFEMVLSPSYVSIKPAGLRSPKGGAPLYKEKISRTKIDF